MPIRNDLTPAAMDLEPMLGDFMADLRSVWGPTVLMTGSGSGCFGLFPDQSEADDAARAVRGWSRVAFGADLRSRGVVRVEE
jgi:4-diphosphocytidyl-2C-methyl-D-erythritol kinase